MKIYPKILCESFLSKAGHQNACDVPDFKAEKIDEVGQKRNKKPKF